MNDDGSAQTGIPAQPIRFLLVGVASYVVDAGLLWLTVAVLRWPLPLGTTFAFLCAFFVNFGLGRTWVFPNSGRQGTQLVRYVALVVVNYLLTLGGMALLTSFGVTLLVAKTLIVAFTAILNFFVGRSWVFR